MSNMWLLTFYACTFIGISALDNSNGLESREKIQLSERFILDNLVPSKLKKEECILCKCYKECHASQYLIDENSVCDPYWNSIKCSEIDRCSCCNDLVLYHPCKRRGQCTNTGNGNFTCKCIAGFYGQECEHAGIQQAPQTTDYCASSPCLNGATCIVATNTHTCTCQHGWTGKNCEKGIQPVTQAPDYCASSPCLNGATCIVAKNTFTCTCQKGWTGNNCEKDINECSSNPCKGGETCIDTIGGFQCRQTVIFGYKNFTAGTLGKCDHICTIETIAKLKPVVSDQTDVCNGTNIRASNEALLVECCGLGKSTTWFKGIQVMQLCNNNDTVSSYTSIAAVKNGKVVPDSAGVLTACNSNGSGFKMILQKCNASPQVITVDGTNGDDPNNYFVMFKL